MAKSPGSQPGESGSKPLGVTMPPWRNPGILATSRALCLKGLVGSNPTGGTRVYVSMECCTITNVDREHLAAIVASSKSYREVMLRLGKSSGSAWHQIKRLIAEFEIDISHFLGRRANSGTSHRGGPEKYTCHNVHTCTTPLRVSILRRILKESGREYKCENCGNTGIWNDRLLELEVDHIDGNTCNSTLTNLRYMCPNCHAQTTTHGFRGRQHSKETRRAISESRQRGGTRQTHHTQNVAPSGVRVRFPPLVPDPRLNRPGINRPWGEAIGFSPQFADVADLADAPRSERGEV